MIYTSAWSMPLIKPPLMPLIKIHPIDSSVMRARFLGFKVKAVRLAEEKAKGVLLENRRRLFFRLDRKLDPPQIVSRTRGSVLCSLQRRLACVGLSRAPKQ